MPMTPALYHPRHLVQPAGPRRSTLRRAFEALLATIALLFGVGCSEQNASTAEIIGDRTAPVVALHAVPGADTSLSFAVDARDDLGLKTVQVRLSGGVTRAFDTTFTSAVTNVTLPLSYFVSRGVPVGTTVLAVASATDGALNTSKPDTLRLTVGNVTPPKAEITGPVTGTLFVIGKSGVLSISGKSKLKVRALGYQTSGPYVHADSVIFASPLRDSVAILDTLTIPDSVKTGVLVVTPFIIDSLGQRATGDIMSYAVQSVTSVNTVPVVTPGVSLRMELYDTVHVAATDPVGITRLGYEVRTLAGALITADSALLSGKLTVAETTFTSKLRVTPPTQVTVRAFAVNSAGRRSYAKLPNTADRADTVFVVDGITRSLPNGGTVADGIYLPSWDRLYLTNIERNQLEVFSLPDTAFLSPVIVGSRPWGIAPWPRDRQGTMGDTLLVANSGGTNISKVCINPAVCGSFGEILSQRIQTRNTIVQTVTSTRDAATGKIVLTLGTPISYSDRPQYVQQSAGGRLYYSTRPTTTAPAGTIRWLDPKLAVPDPRQVYQYAEKTVDNTYAVFNADSMAVIKYPNDPVKSDELIMFDHIYGQKFGGSCTAPQTNGTVATVANTICGRDSVVMDAVSKVAAQGGDIDARLDVDVGLLGLTDTTFVASSGDRNWIGFGEGGGKGRVMMVEDLAGDPQPRFFSPGTAVNDLLDNASENVLGMGLDLHGSTVAVHGQQSYFATVEDPFHLRLQGKYDSFDRGAGIAFHPSADLRSTAVSSSKSDSTRTAFVASANGTIEVVDAAYFTARGALQVKGTLYGPLRASLPFPTDNVGIPASDPRYVIVKLFGLTSNGLVVINLRAQDIAPVP